MISTLPLIRMQSFSSITKVRESKFKGCGGFTAGPEKYHSTPETQTDESYNHPEDLEHFAHHREIELKEAEKEAKFQGITVEEVLEAMHDGGSSEPHAEQDIHADDPSLGMPSKPKITRQTPPEKLDPSIRYADAARERGEQAGWGEGDSGYKTPKTPNERMRYVEHSPSLTVS